MEAARQSNESEIFSIRHIAIYQASGIFFILFYYSDQLLITINANFPEYPLSSYVNSVIISIYHFSDNIQKSLFKYYPTIMASAIYSLFGIYALILVFSLAKGSLGAFLRATIFFTLGLIAIPFTLLIWTLRWIPGYLLDILLHIFELINGLLSIIGILFADIVRYFWTPISLLFLFTIFIMVIYLIYMAIRHAVISSRIILIAISAISLIVISLSFWKYFESLFEIIFYLGDFVISGISFAFSVVAHVFSFIVSTIILLSLVALVAIISMFVTSQFGHILLDTLFDARNVSRNARAAGRFLAGIGFLASTVILCFPENALARQGAILAVQEASRALGYTLSASSATTTIDSLVNFYLLFIPDSIEGNVTKAFSFGYPPSLEIFLMILSCIIAFLLIFRQLFTKETQGNISIAFYPRELIPLLLAASLVLLLVFAYSDTESAT